MLNPALPTADPSTRLFRRRTALALALTALLALPVVALAPAASAHDRLVSSTPRDGSTVDGAEQLTLTYSEKLVATGYDVVVDGPSGPVESDVRVGGAQLVDRFATPLAAGRYRVTWRVVSTDGHPISGRLAFVVRDTAAAEGTGTPKTSPTPTTPESSPSATAAGTVAASAPSTSGGDAGDGQDTGPGGAALITVLVLAGAACAGLIVVSRRRRARDET